MYDTFLRLRGKTYDYKIAYDQVVKLFLLPKPDDMHVLFVVGVDPPLRQGQTRYGFLVVQFTREEDMEVELNIEEYQPPITSFPMPLFLNNRLAIFLLNPIPSINLTLLTL
jgi:hypothetical protein